jgi:CDP-diglyceride synthetase
MRSWLWKRHSSPKGSNAVNGLGVPIAVVVIGLFNAWLARTRKATWFGRGSWLMVIGGCVLVLTDLLHRLAFQALYVAAALLIVAMICLLVSIVKRELRITLE